MNGKSDYCYDSINISTNLSNNSTKDIRYKNKANQNKGNNKTEIKKKNQSTKVIYNKKNLTDLSIISDYTSNKSKTTNIDFIFKNNSNSSRSKKSIISKKIENTVWNNGGNYKKYKKKK
jgi:hypothetical protein